MNWQRIQRGWSGLHCRISAAWAKALGRDIASVRVCDALSSRKQDRYGISRKEANRCAAEWIRDPGVLDDWNDTRSILDM